MGCLTYARSRLGLPTVFSILKFVNNCIGSCVVHIERVKEDVVYLCNYMFELEGCAYGKLTLVYV